MGEQEAINTIAGKYGYVLTLEAYGAEEYGGPLILVTLFISGTRSEESERQICRLLAGKQKSDSYKLAMVYTESQ